MRQSGIGLTLGTLVTLAAANGDCPGYEYSCAGRCYGRNYFSVMGYGHDLLTSGTSINGWPVNYTVPANSSIELVAGGPTWGAFPILQDSEEFYDGTQEVLAIVTWGEYWTYYQTSNIIDMGVDNDYVQTDCGGPDD